MKHLRMTARPPLEAAPGTLRTLVASEHVDETRWLSWNVADSRGITVLFRVRGDRAAVAAALSDAPEVVEADVGPDDGGAFFLLATLDPTASPLTERVFAAIHRDGLVLLPIVANRDGAVEVQLVGEAAAVGAVVDALPAAVDVEVHEVRERGFAGAFDAAAALSDRQREAVLAALELGYYDQPRAATHEDVATALDCAASTASEHLRKAEAKLVRAAMRGDR